MESIATISFDFQPVTARSQRTALIQELYSLYTSQPDENKKENRKRYYAWVRLNHPNVCKKAGFSKERYDSFKPEFKKAKLPKEQKFVTYLSPSFFAIKLSHIPTEDLHYLISRARDVSHRKGCVAAMILGSIKV